MKRSIKFAALLALTVAAAGVARIQPQHATTPPPAEAKPLPALALFGDARFQPGLYQINVTDTPRSQPTASCIARPEQLVRLRHAALAGCSHLVVENTADRATVQYECPAQGWGRTSVKLVEGAGYKIETQGIAGREPFAQTVDARRTGACPASDRR